MSVLIVWKEEGLTPYNTVQSIKQTKQYADNKIGFAGRLDPMAKGIMLLLVGEANKRRKHYERLPKTYKFEVLIGISTDTYDILGIPKLNSTKTDINFPSKAAELVGKHIQEYPPYSYPKVQGKALYWWARNGRLNEIEIPKKEIEIFECTYLGSHKVSFSQLINNIKRRIAKVNGDFRQKEILNTWQDLYKKNKDKEFLVAKFQIKCKGGTYVRSIANDMGGLALSITRIAVGRYTRDSVISIYEDKNSKGKIV